METGVTHEEYIEKCRHAAIQVCQDVLAGKRPLISAVRQLRQLLAELGVDDHQDDFVAFVVLDSEADHLPVGPVREQWHPEALALKDKEIAEVEKSYKFEVHEACKRLLRLLQEAV